MKCSACETRLAAYLDGEVSAADARAIQQHLQSCVACRALAGDIRTVETRLAGLHQIEPRADFTLGVMSAVAALPVPKPARFDTRWLLVYLAGAWALLFALGAAHVLNWQRLFAEVATEFGKFGAAGETLAQVGMRLHVPTLAAGMLSLEIVIVLVGALALRRFIPHVSSWIAGAQVI